MALDELTRRLKPFLDETIPFVQKLVETDWTAVLSDHEKSFLSMAERGWTLPDCIDLGDMRTLHLKPPEKLDRYFVEGFMAHGAKNLIWSDPAAMRAIHPV